MPQQSAQCLRPCASFLPQVDLGSIWFLDLRTRPCLYSCCFREASRPDIFKTEAHSRLLLRQNDRSFTTAAAVALQPGQALLRCPLPTYSPLSYPRGPLLVRPVSNDTIHHLARLVDSRVP